MNRSHCQAAISGYDFAYSRDTVLMETASTRIAPWAIFWKKVGTPNMARPLNTMRMIRTPIKVPNTWNSFHCNITMPEIQLCHSRERIALAKRYSCNYGNRFP